jgi:hypothetical protein
MAVSVALADIEYPVAVVLDLADLEYPLADSVKLPVITGPPPGDTGFDAADVDFDWVDWAFDE